MIEAFFTFLFVVMVSSVVLRDITMLLAPPLQPQAWVLVRFSAVPLARALSDNLIGSTVAFLVIQVQIGV
jgi:hypothetical protein